MDQKRVTLVVSDLHMGDGAPGDDFVDDSHQFANFIRAQAATPEGHAGDIELIINGDFLEFVQVLPDAYTLDSSTYWCAEGESVSKLDRILTGHPDVFEALNEFQKQHNRVTVFAGNHDVDLYWEAVQRKIREKAGDINIETGQVTFTRYGGRLRISHGHLFDSIDPANNFQNWHNPILSQPADANPKRLEMCPGTLFVVKFVNFLEEKYPFADNLHPVTALAGILGREDRWGLTAVAWSMLRFTTRYPKAFLSAEGRGAEVGAQLLNAIQSDSFLRGKIASVYRDVLGQPGMNAAQVKQALDSEDAISTFIEQLLRAEPAWDKWLGVLDMAKPGVLGIGEAGGNTLSIVAAGKVDVRAACIEIARAQWKAGADIVILGHTHLPQTFKEGNRVYYNPGSWTRYVENAETLTLEQLKDETRFPYELNCVRVAETDHRTLQSELVCLDKRATG
jgi:UDP-2,3-diacylglucosamine pyrophosphatase LpxH